MAPAWSSLCWAASTSGLRDCSKAGTIQVTFSAPWHYVPGVVEALGAPGCNDLTQQCWSSELAFMEPRLAMTLALYWLEMELPMTLKEVQAAPHSAFFVTRGSHPCPGKNVSVPEHLPHTSASLITPVITNGNPADIVIKSYGC